MMPVPKPVLNWAFMNSAPGTVPSLDLVPSHEETLLREAVAGIASGFGQEYVRGKVEAGEPPTELWEALAERGYLGVNIPEEYDGGGRGHHRGRNMA